MRMPREAVEESRIIFRVTFMHGPYDVRIARTVAQMPYV